MKYLAASFLTTLLALNLNAQENDSYWTLNLASHFYNDNSSMGHAVDVDEGWIRDIYNSSTGLYVMQPSFRKYQGHTITEFGLRNTGWTNETNWIGNNYSFNSIATRSIVSTLSQTSAQTTLFFARSARVLGSEKSGLFLGGDISLTPSFQSAEFWDNLDQSNYYRFSTTSLTLGIGVIPSYQLSLGNKLYLDFSAIMTIINTSYEMQNLGTHDTFGQRNSVFKYSLGGHWTPQLGIGLKI
jgi:hypothetical protein